MNSENDQQQDSEDPTIKMLNAKRLLELRRRLKTTGKESTKVQKSSTAVTDRELLLKALVDRGDEVLFSAESRYPEEMRILIPKLSDLIKQGKVSTISGGELLQFLRAIGMRVSVATSITVEDHGKFVSLSDKLKQKMKD